MKVSKRTLIQHLLVLILTVGLGTGVALAQGEEPEPPRAEIVNDEGGAVSITGVVTYTNPFFTAGVAQPVIITEDQAGFVDRNEYFLMPEASQTLGQITSDFYASPFSYALTLPIEPQGSYRDVDQDAEEERGVQIYAIAYWDNTFGDAFLEERDLAGGGWSTAYASTRISTDPEKDREIIGGKFLVYAPDDQQGFPSGFGEDGRLFTADDPIVTLPQGYTVVDMDREPFAFDRSRYPVIDLIEPDRAALVDLSDLPYDEAFDELVDILSREYAFTEYKDIDWEAKRTEYLPRFQTAAENDDALTYLRALREFTCSIPDQHLSAPFLAADFQRTSAGGVGLAIRELDDGRIIASFVLADSPADEAGIQVGTEIVAINGIPIADAVEDTEACWAWPFSAEHYKRYQQLRYVTRFPLGADVSITFLDAEAGEVTAEMTAEAESESFTFSSLNRGLTGLELPLEYTLLDSGYGYVKIYSFIDNSLLTVQLWERLMQELNQAHVPGLIIDMRQNLGGFGFLTDQMAAYFFNEPLVLGNTAYYDEERGEFYVDPRGEQRFYLPAEELRYNGAVAVLVGPSCTSACEYFAYDLTLQDRATIVGMYPTAGAGGAVRELLLPENETFRYSVGRNLDPEGNILVEGRGVAPDVRVPVTEETLLAGGDPVLDAAVEHLDEALSITVLDGGDVAMGARVEGRVERNVVVHYTISVAEGDVLNLYVESDEMNPNLGIYDTDGNLLLANDDQEGQQTTNAGIENLAIPRDQILILEVSSATGAEAGRYTLVVEDAAEATEAEPPEAGSAAETPAEPTASTAGGANVVETALATGNFEFLVTALDVAGLLAELEGEGPFTVFAPTDEAFAFLDPGLLAALLEDPEALAAVLRHHVVAGKMTVAEMLELSEVVTLTANPLAITSDDDSVLIGGARVLEADVLASNGIIHAIDRVLLPPDLDLP